MRTFGLIGYPLAHSFSEKYFSNKFKIEGINDAVFKNFEIKSIDSFIEIIRKEKNLKGLSVTSPYKTEVIKYLDDIDNEADKIGAVNAVKIRNINGKLHLKGYNTDVYGFINSFEKEIFDKIKTALIIGTGGAADAVSYGLGKFNITYKFLTRNKINKETYINYSELSEEDIRTNLLIINATPVGMFPDVNEKPSIPYEFVCSDHILYDLIYNPAVTSFLKEGKKRNATIINGRRMLELQAEKAWQIFNS